MKSPSATLFPAAALLATVAVLGMHTASASAASLGATPASASGLNLVTNGSFELTGPLNRGNWGTFTSIPGWQATPGGRIEVQRNAAGKAYNGQNLVELDSHDYNTNIPVLGLFQDITTKVGKAYTLSFMYSARPGTAANQNIFSVLFGNNFSTQITAGAGGKQTSWQNFTTTVIANSTLTRLQFNYSGPRDTYGAYIDDVQLIARDSTQSVPEPTVMAGLVVVGVGLMAGKKRKVA